MAYGLTLEDVGLLFVLLALQDANGGLPVELPDVCAMVRPKVPSGRLQRVLDRYFPVSFEGDRRRNEKFDQARSDAAAAHAAKVRGGLTSAAKRRGTTPAVTQTTEPSINGTRPRSGVRSPDNSDGRSPGRSAGSSVGKSPARTPGRNKNQNQSQNQIQPTPPDPSPSSVVDAPATAAEGSPLDRLLQRLTAPADQLAIRAFLERCPEQEQLAWTQRLAGYLQGMGFPAGMLPTPEQLALACSDYSVTPPSPVHFRAFILRLMQGGKPRTGPRPPKATIEEQYEAGQRWAERGRRADAGL
jgi:hypothetical protein